MSDFFKDRIAELISQPDNATFEEELAKFVAWIRDARRRLRGEDN
jgi:hypothetical protein